MKLERMVLKGGVHELDIYYRNILHNKREAILRCTDDDTCTINIKTLIPSLKSCKRQRNIYQVNP
jgi:hypothetical protein